MRDGVMVVTWASAYLLRMGIQWGPWRSWDVMADRYFVYRIVLYQHQCGCIFSLN